MSSYGSTCLGTVELDGVLGADFLSDQELCTLLAVVALQLDNHAVFSMLYNASIATEELDRSKKEKQKGQLRNSSNFH